MIVGIIVLAIVFGIGWTANGINAIRKLNRLRDRYNALPAREATIRLETLIDVLKEAL